MGMKGANEAIKMKESTSSRHVSCPQGLRHRYTCLCSCIERSNNPLMINKSKGLSLGPMKPKMLPNSLLLSTPPSYQPNVAGTCLPHHSLEVVSTLLARINSSHKTHLPLVQHPPHTDKTDSNGVCELGRERSLCDRAGGERGCALTNSCTSRRCCLVGRGGNCEEDAGRRKVSVLDFQKHMVIPFTTKNY